jgi:uncharacterized membrane protein YccC
VGAFDGIRNGAKHEDAQLEGALESLQQSLEDLGEDTEMYKILLHNLTNHEEFPNLLAR